MERCSFAGRVGISPFKVIMILLCPICTLTWRVNICVFRQEKGVNRRNQSTIFVFIVCTDTFVTHFPVID